MLPFVQLILSVKRSSVIFAVTTELCVDTIEILPRPKKNKRFVFFKRVERLWAPLSRTQWVPGAVYPGGSIATPEGVNLHSSVGAVCTRAQI
jgi:hypothetical protein